MRATHSARITWSTERVRRGLWTAHERIVPAWFGPGEDGWSLVCKFEQPPAEQGSPSLATVSFWVDAAPHDRLRAGAQLTLFDESGDTSVVEILD